MHDWRNPKVGKLKKEVLKIQRQAWHVMFPKAESIRQKMRSI